MGRRTGGGGGGPIGAREGPVLRCDWPGVAPGRGSLWSVEKGCGAGSAERDSGEEAHSDSDSEATDFLQDTVRYRHGKRRG